MFISTSVNKYNWIVYRIYQHFLLLLLHLLNIFLTRSELFLLPVNVKIVGVWQFLFVFFSTNVDNNSYILEMPVRSKMSQYSEAIQNWNFTMHIKRKKYKEKPGETRQWIFTWNAEYYLIVSADDIAQFLVFCCKNISVLFHFLSSNGIGDRPILLAWFNKTYAKHIFSANKIIEHRIKNP